MLEYTYLVETCDGNSTIMQGRNKKHVIAKFKAHEKYYTVSDITAITKLDITTLLESYFIANETSCFV